MATDNNNKVLNVPNLRFPEFTEEWRKYDLSDCSFFRSERINTSELDIENYISTENMLQNFQGISIANSIPDNINVTSFKEGDILISNIRPYLKKVWQADRNGGCSADVFVLKANNTICSDCFLHYLIANDTFINFVMSGAKGVKMPRGDKKQMVTYNMGIPHIKEQNKISRLLDLLNKRIVTQNKIIEQLQSLIKGIVVSITTETPNTRIDKCLVCHSSTLQENHIEDFGDFPVYGANGICGYTVNADYNEPAILIVKDGSGVGNVRFVNGKYSVIGTQNILTPQNRFCLKYIFYCLKAFNFMPYKTGMAIPHIYFKDYGKAKIYCPNFEQQVKIAFQIDLLESKIEIETQLLNKYEEQKKFLLSNMFI